MVYKLSDAVVEAGMDIASNVLSRLVEQLDKRFPEQAFDRNMALAVAMGCLLDRICQTEAYAQQYYPAFSEALQAAYESCAPQIYNVEGSIH